MNRENGSQNVVISKTGTHTKKNGIRSFNISSMESLVILHATNRFAANGGVIKPISRFKRSIAPKCTKSMP